MFGMHHCIAHEKYTLEYLKKHPDTDKTIVWISPGLEMGVRTMWRLGREFIKKGMLPIYHQYVYGDSREDKADSLIEHMQEVEKETGLKDMHLRNDAIFGQSAGGIMAIYMCGDPRISKYGINPLDDKDLLTVQAIAPPLYGIRFETIPQKLVGLFLGVAENAETEKGRREAVNLFRRKRLVPYTVYSGLNDRLVRPRESYDPQAAQNITIKHLDSTHFGTSGGNKNMNTIFADAVYKRHKNKMRKKKQK